MAYTAVIELPEGGLALATAGKTTEAVGALVDYPNGGRLILLPEMDRDFWKRDDGSDSATQHFDLQAAQAFYASLVRATRAAASAETAPAWVDKISTIVEQDLALRHKAASEALAVAQRALNSLNTERAGIAADKILLYGSGDSLAVQCASVLIRFGAKRLPAPSNRADLRFAYGDRVLVIEVKGLSKSAKEENAAQLEKWVMEEVSAGTSFKSIKALLITNTFRHKPPHQRDVSFPSQMVPMSTERHHALVTTTQLFVLASRVADRTMSAEDAMTLLISTTGVLQGFGADQLMMRGDAI